MHVLGCIDMKYQTFFFFFWLSAVFISVLEKAEVGKYRIELLERGYWVPVTKFIYFIFSIRGPNLKFVQWLKKIVVTVTKKCTISMAFQQYLSTFSYDIPMSVVPLSVPLHQVFLTGVPRKSGVCIRVPFLSQFPSECLLRIMFHHQSSPPPFHGYGPATVRL